jgi:hypothetical protein
LRTALICHADSLDREVMPPWLASFSDVVGVVVIHDPPAALARRVRFEWRRSKFRIVDVFAFRLYYWLRLARRDRVATRAYADATRRRFPDPGSLPTLHTTTPNSPETREFLELAGPDVVLARCRMLLKKEVFTIPEDGTFVVHPGICPEYRNAHGCFWALARRDLGHVGATLLRIDEGIDTGPIFAFYRTDVDERSDSHVVIQQRVVFDNLDNIQRDLRAIHQGEAEPIDVSGHPSAVWGQPRLTDYVRWKVLARRES